MQVVMNDLKVRAFLKNHLRYHLFRYFWVASHVYLLFIMQALIYPLGATFVP